MDKSNCTFITEKALKVKKFLNLLEAVVNQSFPCINPRTGS